MGLNDRPVLVKRVEALVRALDSADTRDAALRDLIILGPAVAPIVSRHAISDVPRRRAGVAEIMKAYKAWSANHPNGPAAMGRALDLQSRVRAGTTVLVGRIIVPRFRIDSPHGRLTVKLGQVHRVRPAEAWAARIKPAKADRVVVDMRDKTQVKGAAITRALRVQTPHGTMTVAIGQIQEATFDPDGKSVRVLCRNMDRIVGTLGPKATISLKTGAGRADLAAERIEAVTVFTGSLDDGLAFHWSFDKKDATERITGVKGRVDGPVTFDKGIIGSAPTFRNYKTRIVLQSPRLSMNGWRQVTFSAWMKFNTYSTYGTVIGRTDDVNAYGVSYSMGGTYSGRWIGAGFAVHLADGARESVSPEGLKKGTKPYPKKGVWYHVVGTYDGRAVRIYINGKLDGQTKVAQAGKTLADSPKARTVIGRAAAKKYDSWRDTFFPGPIDEIKIWRRALSAGEVRALYTETLNKAKAG